MCKKQHRYIQALLRNIRDTIRSLSRKRFFKMFLNGITRNIRPTRMQLWAQRVRHYAASKEEIGKMVDTEKVVVFMKGTPEEPMCGFSKAMVTVLQLHDVPFKSYDVLADEEVRQGVKDYSEWPTIPQLYINKKFIGGCDIVVEMHQSGDILKTLRDGGVRSKYDDTKE